MSREEMLADAHRRADAAVALRENHYLNESLDRLEARYIADWRSGADTAAREVAHHRLKALEDLKSELFGAIDDVKVLRHNVGGS